MLIKFCRFLGFSIKNLLKSIKYKEIQEKSDKLFGGIKEKYYFCKRVETSRGRNSKQ